MNTSRSQHMSLKYLMNFFASGTMIVQLETRWLKLWTGLYQATALPFARRTVKEWWSLRGGLWKSDGAYEEDCEAYEEDCERVMELTRCSKFTRNYYSAHGRSKQELLAKSTTIKILHTEAVSVEKLMHGRMWSNYVWKIQKHEKEIDRLYEEIAHQALQGMPGLLNKGKPIDEVSPRQARRNLGELLK